MEEVIRVAPDENYFDHCHNHVCHVQSQVYLLKVGLYVYVDSLPIGYDTSTKEIILPIDETHYYSIKLRFDRAADEETAQKILRHYNLKPNETAKWNLYKDETGKLIDGSCNYDKPYRDDSPFAALNAKVQAKIKERREMYARYHSRTSLC